MRAPTIGAPGVNELIGALICLAELTTEFTHWSSDPALFGNLAEVLAPKTPSTRGGGGVAGVRAKKRNPRERSYEGLFPQIMRIQSRLKENRPG